MNQDVMLNEVEMLIRSMPDKEALSNHSTDNYVWLGQLSAIMDEMGPLYFTSLQILLPKLHSGKLVDSFQGLRDLNVLLYKARSKLLLQTTRPTSILANSGRTFDYFDEIRKIIELANTDVLFVDPYLDAEFVSKYLPYVKDKVAIRLLAGSQKIKTLLPAVTVFSEQSENNISLKVNAFHDRFIFIDRVSCYQSGTSFKDGAKKAPATITQIFDAFDAMFQTYESLWDSGEERFV